MNSSLEIYNENVQNTVNRDPKNHVKSRIKYVREISQDPSNILPYKKLADNLFKQEKYDAAVSVYKKILLISPRDVNSYFRLAKIFRLQELYDKEEAIYKSLMNNFWEDGDVYSCWADSLWAQGKKFSAITKYLKALKTYAVKALYMFRR